jgi:hypothetical protein
MQLSLSVEEVKMLKGSLRAALDERIFPEWEFHTLTGFNREAVKRLLDFNGTHELDSTDALLLKSVLVNLLGYPHGMEKELELEYGLTQAGMASFLGRF